MNRPRMKRVVTQRRDLCVLSLIACASVLLWFSCGGGERSTSANSSDPPSTATPLTTTDVMNVVQNAVTSVNQPMVVAVADRAGNILAVYETPKAPTSSVGNFGQVVSADESAVALARTAAFFSNDQAPLSSRTVRFISGIHFPPGVPGTPNADLYGIENTNRGCTLSPAIASAGLKPSLGIDGISFGPGIITGKADVNDSQPFAVNPGGVPLFKGGAVGGVGVVTTSSAAAEYAAYSGATNSGLLSLAQLPPPGVVIIGGIALPFVNQMSLPAGTSTGNLSNYLTTGYSSGPIAGKLPPEGFLVGPNAGSVLSASDVNEIIMNAVATANMTRAVIRLPPNSYAKMTIAVSDLNGTLLGLYRMHDGTVFSVDVAATKARNVIWFSSNPGVSDLPGVPSGTAVTNRTISFGAQPLFPPGIDGSGPGPFFSLYEYDTANACTQGPSSAALFPAPNTNNMSGIVFFPGSLPLYRNGVLVGGLGVSGDGVDQDDFVTAGAVNAACGFGGPCDVPDFQAPTNIRADQVVIDNVRLPYQKFPRNPTQ
jgi:uncharacterized protein GlcG (DUF336 family)